MSGEKSVAGDKHFTTLELGDFRGFTRLKLDGLKRVSLVVGKNNVGKTSLLEGVALACDPQLLNSLPGLLRASSGDQQRRFFPWLVRDGAPAAAILTVSSATRTLTTSIDRHGPMIFTEELQPWGSCRLISVQMHSPDDVVRLYSLATRKRSGEEQIQSLFKRIDGRVRKVRVVVEPDGSHILVDLGLSEMIPLSQAGQGLYRLLVVLSELIGETPDVCLLDEIENGLHYSAYEDVWAGLAQATDEMGVQLIATTHSRECLEAAHRAFSARPTYDLSVVQLFRIESGIEGRVLDDKMVAAALAGDIDLR